MATDYDINYDDQRFKNVEADKQNALDNVNSTYNNMINNSDQYYLDQIAAAKDYANTQSKLQQDNTDLAINQINQQKDQANKDYTKEQKGAYADWQKQSNQFGANAETQASQGLTNTGFSESSQVSMYNQYQGRVVSARETFQKAVLNYDNSIKEAKLANNSKLAEIAYNALQTQLQLSLEGFQYKNTLLQTQIDQQNQTEDRYYQRWQDVQGQINTENQFKESIRQYEQNYDMQVKEFDEGKRQFEQNYALQKQQYQEGIRQFDENIKYLKDKDAKENAIKIQQLEEQKKEFQAQMERSDREYLLETQKLAEQRRQYDLRLQEDKREANLKYYSGLSEGVESTNNYEVNTQYYQGKRADNVGGFGYFSNRYQPKGVIDTSNGKAYQLSKTNKTAGEMYGKGAVNSSGVSVANQNVWKANGKYYIWNGTKNTYERVK